MDWTPDSKSIVFWAGGKIRRVDMAGNAAVIPFRVNDTRVVIDPPQPKIDVAPDSFRTKMPRYVSVSPDSKRAVFESLGKLYVKQLPNGAPTRVTQSKGAEQELFPSWSRDGKTIAYVEWTDAGLGHIRTIGATGELQRLSRRIQDTTAGRVFRRMGKRSCSRRARAAICSLTCGRTIRASFACPPAAGRRRK